MREHRSDMENFLALNNNLLKAALSCKNGDNTVKFLLEKIPTLENSVPLFSNLDSLMYEECALEKMILKNYQNSVKLCGARLSLVEKVTQEYFYEETDTRNLFSEVTPILRLLVQ
jgi:hypothetical protein